MPFGMKACKVRAKTARLFRKVIKNTLQPEEVYSVSKWAEEKRVLDNSSNLSGKWSNAFTPYLCEIMDTLNDPYVREVYFCKPTQVGGTEALINMLCYIADASPAPTMVVYPTDDLAKDTSNARIKPAFRLIPSINRKFLDNQSKELELRFRGMNIYLRGAGSPSKLASKAIKYLFFDEIDKMGGASKKEASPFSLAKERTKTYKPQEKIFATSTPTIRSNYIWDLKENAEEEKHFFVPCPHCGEMIELSMKSIKYSNNESLSNEDRANTANYYCQECGTEIVDGDKPKMLRNGEWRTVRKRGIGHAKKVAYWMNTLYSIFIKWSDVAKEFLDSKDDPEKLQNFVNSWLAEPWEDAETRITEDSVLNAQTDIEEFIVPDWAKLVTGGVDVQKNSLYYTIRAWGDYSTSQNITHGQVVSWEDIERVMNRIYETEDGNRKFAVELCLIDSGYNQDETLEFCINNSDWAKPVKGASNDLLDRFKISKIEKTGSFNGMQLILTDGNKYKDSISNRMKRVKGENTGAWMVYKGCDKRYSQMITAEQRVTEKTRTGIKSVWKPKAKHLDNHYLDCEVYAMAAAEILGIRYEHLRNVPSLKTVQAENNASDNNQSNNWIQTQDNWLGG